MRPESKNKKLKQEITMKELILIKKLSDSIGNIINEANVIKLAMGIWNA